MRPTARGLDGRGCCERSRATTAAKAAIWAAAAAAGVPLVVGAAAGVAAGACSMDWGAGALSSSGRRSRVVYPSCPLRAAGRQIAISPAQGKCRVRLRLAPSRSETSHRAGQASVTPRAASSLETGTEMGEPSEAGQTGELLMWGSLEGSPRQGGARGSSGCVSRLEGRVCLLQTSSGRLPLHKGLPFSGSLLHWVSRCSGCSTRSAVLGLHERGSTLDGG